MALLTFNLNKNHIFFPLLFLSYFLRDLIKEIRQNLTKDKKLVFGNSYIVKITLIEIYLLTPSNLFVILLFIIERVRTKKDNKSDKLVAQKPNIHLQFHKRSFVGFRKVLKLVVLTSTFNFIPRIIIFFLFFFVNDDKNFISSSTLSSVSIFYILATSLLSRIFLSSYYYRHHFISLAINIFSLIINIIIDVRNLDNKYIIILYIINMLGTISYSSASISGKFLLTYITPYALELYIGLVQIVYLIIMFIPLYFIERNGENIFNNFFEICDDYRVVLLYIANMIFICAYGVFIWIIINKFSPNDYALSMMVENMIDKLFEYVTKPNSFTDNIFISIVQIFIFLLLIIGICIHNEIIIINKCGLDEYTKNKISMKGEKDANDIYNINDLNESFDKSNSIDNLVEEDEEMF